MKAECAWPVLTYRLVGVPEIDVKESILDFSELDKPSGDKRPTVLEQVLLMVRIGLRWVKMSVTSK